MQQHFQLTGSFRGLLLFDVAESIDLGLLHRILGTNPNRREPAFRHPAPEYVRFERPPVIEQVGTRQVRGSENVEIRIRYFEYGVASVEMLMPFSSSWNELASLTSRWIVSAELEGFATSLLRESLVRTGPALGNPYREWISEDYYVVQLDPISTDGGAALSAEQLVRDRGGEIA